ncbi:MAG: hypothetical protein ABI833_01830 [Acidobacteriota bacterium]
MLSRSITRFHSLTKVLSGTSVVLALLLSPALFAQNNDRYRGDNRDRGQFTTIEPGTLIAVRTAEPINVERTDNRIFRARVDQDVRGSNGRLAIPRGSRVELIVRVARDNDLILDLDSVTVSGRRYGIDTNRNRVESQGDNSLIGTIFGAIAGGEVQGRAVRVPRGTQITFRMQQPLHMGAVDRGVNRRGRHYHDYYGR